MKGITEAVTEEQVIKIDHQSEKMCQEVGFIAMGVPDGYDW